MHFALKTDAERAHSKEYDQTAVHAGSGTSESMMKIALRQSDSSPPSCARCKIGPIKIYLFGNGSSRERTPNKKSINNNE